MAEEDKKEETSPVEEKADAAPQAEDTTPEKAEQPAAEEPKEEPKEEPAAEKPKEEPVAEPVEGEAEAEAEEAVPEEPKKAPKKKPAKKAAPKETKDAGEEAPAEAEAEETPKKKPAKKAAPKKKKKKEEPEEGAAPEVEVIETVDERTAIKVSYAVKPLFGKYSFSGVVVPNPGLQRYINIEPVSIPHTGARHANRPFAKQHMNIVERLINGMMRTEHGTGQKAKMYRVVEEAFDIIERRTKENPIQVYIDALCNSAPKEEVTRLRYGGINVPKAVDVSASRRLDIALRNVCKGAVQSSHKSRKRLPQSLADEIILASKRDINSYAVGKKEELERIAASAR